MDAIARRCGERGTGENSGAQCVAGAHRGVGGGGARCREQRGAYAFGAHFLFAPRVVGESVQTRVARRCKRCRYRDRRPGGDLQSGRQAARGARLPRIVRRPLPRIHAAGRRQRDRAIARSRRRVGQASHRTDRSHSFFFRRLARRQQRLFLFEAARRLRQTATDRALR